MLIIRLSRIGKKHAPMYRLIISEKTKDPYGRALEILGSYNPTSKELVAKGERIQYWISKGAQMSPTVNNLLITQEVIKGEKVKASKAGTKKKAPVEPKAAPQPAVTETPVEAAPIEETVASTAETPETPVEETPATPAE